MTDYGDEAHYTLPWDLFDQASAEEALAAARRSLAAASEAVTTLREWQAQQTAPEAGGDDAPQET